jgi:hypothetical protein
MAYYLYGQLCPVIRDTYYKKYNLEQLLLHELWESKDKDNK